MRLGSERFKIDATAGATQKFPLVNNNASRYIISFKNATGNNLDSAVTCRVGLMINHDIEGTIIGTVVTSSLMPAPKTNSLFVNHPVDILRINSIQGTGGYLYVVAFHDLVGARIQV